jgi:PPK2 family polyphosphate:nucleotide phosphotransferase
MSGSRINVKEARDRRRRAGPATAALGPHPATAAGHWHQIGILPAPAPTPACRGWIAMTPKIETKRFLVPEDEPIDLKERPTLIEPFYTSKEDYQARISEQIAALSQQQERLYADGRYAVLLVLQAMDTAGKDGIIKHVLTGINPQGCEVFSFKQPSAEELKHDFLWRAACRLPERGRIGIFNRSYYEDVLVVRVHPELLLAQGLAEARMDPDAIWKQRFHSIRGFERHLYRNGTIIIKLFLHLSKEEQRKRLLERLEQPDKNWKFSTYDLKERDMWKDYQKAYEHCVNATSSREGPWMVVPADDKKNARLIVSAILLEAMQALGLQVPVTSPARRRELEALRLRL